MNAELRDELADTLRIDRSFSEDSIVAIAIFEIKKLQTQLDAERAKPKAGAALDPDIKALQTAQLALDRLRHRCWSLASDPDSIVDQTIAELTRLRAIEAEKQVAPPADPDLDRIKRERGEARAALNRIQGAFCDGACGLFDPDAIADRAVKVIKEAREKRTEPPKCPGCQGTGKVSIFAGGKIPCAVCPNKAPTPEPPKKAVYEWVEPLHVFPARWLLYRGKTSVGNTWPTLKGSHFWEAMPGPNQSTSGTAVTLPLAQAAVEAVVRAYYGDEA